jgi:glycosyltransferase involved in cell wall biosynthesis
MKKDKINLIIFTGYFLPHIGGLETHVDEFTKYLSKDKKYNITIFAPQIPNESKRKEIIHNNVKVIRYPAFEIISNFPIPKFWSYRFWKLYFSLYKKQYDIVMTRTRFFFNSFLGLVFSKFRFKRIKLIHVEHGSSFVILESKFKTKVAKLYDLTIGKLVFKLANKNIAISLAVQNFMCKEFNLKKKEVPIIRRGIDIKYINKFKEDKQVREKYKDKVILCYIGRLYKWKGLANAIEAYKNLSKTLQSKSVFIIGGYGEDLERLKKLSGEYLDKNIIFLGKIEYGKNFSLMKSSHIHIHSAYPGGGLSSTLLQFMYCKNAVIASPHEGAKEVIINDKNGVLLKNNSVSELKRGMEIVIKNQKLREKYSKESKKYIEENFNWDRVVDKYEKIFEEVLY